MTALGEAPNKGSRSDTISRFFHDALSINKLKAGFFPAFFLYNSLKVLRESREFGTNFAYLT